MAEGFTPMSEADMIKIDQALHEANLNIEKNLKEWKRKQDAKQAHSKALKTLTIPPTYA